MAGRVVVNVLIPPRVPGPDSSCNGAIPILGDEARPPSSPDEGAEVDLRVGLRVGASLPAVRMLPQRLLFLHPCLA